MSLREQAWGHARYTVTAAVTTYERPKEARRSISSVLDQSRPAEQILVVEDGSETGTREWCEALAEPRLSYVRHPERRGLAAARNTALRHTRSEYLAFLDDDDVWKPERLERQLDLLAAMDQDRRRRMGVVYCGIERRFPDGRSQVVAPTNRGNLRECIQREGPRTLSSTMLFSTAALRAVDGFDESLPSSIDHDIWMALARGGYEVDFVPEPLVVTFSRVRRDTMMMRTEPRIEGVRLFVEKWRPVLRDWMGNREADAFLARYFARVLSHLAVSKVASGDLKGGIRAGHIALRESGSPRRALLQLGRSMAGQVVRSIRG